MSPVGVFAATETIATYGPPGGPALDWANFSTGFELFRNGLYWWQGYGACGEQLNNSEIGFKGFASTATAPTRPVFTCTNTIEAVARDDLKFYFAANRRLYTKASWATINDPAQEIPTQYTPPAVGWDLGAMMLWKDRLYWTDFNGTSFRIRSVDLDGSNPQHLRLGTGGKVIKIVGYSYRSSNFAFTDAIFVLMADGQLTRCNLNPFATNVVLATGVTDFVIRDESIDLFPNGFSFYTAVHVTRGQKYNVNETTLPGSLAMINAASGFTTLLYTAQGQNQLTAVAADTNNLYWTEQPVICPPPFTCSLGDYSLYRQSRPADHSHAPGTVDLIGLPGGGAGVNLRSDNQWLYFLNGTAIKRLPTDAPAVYLDVEALGLEVVQAVQDLNSHVPLVASRPTYVRGYAKLSQNYTGKNNWFSTALLHGFRDGQEFPDSPIFPLKSIALAQSSATLPGLRGSTKNSFLFELPSSWVAPATNNGTAQLTFTMTVNPNLAVPETVPQPLVNNTVSLNQPATLMRGRVPNIITAPLICWGPIYYDFSSGFNLSFQVARVLLPVESMNIHPFLITDPVGDVNHPFAMGHINTNVAEAAWDSALDAVDGLHLWNDPFQGNDEHFLGMVHPMVTQSTGIAGIGTRPGKATVAIMGDYWSGKTIAHELGHNYGRRHVNCGSFPPDQADFDPMTYSCSLGNPNINLATATYGFDPNRNTAYPPNTTADLMSYWSPSWISAINWNIILGVPPFNNLSKFVHDPAQEPKPNSLSSQVMLVRGRIDPSLNVAAFEAFYVIPETAAPAMVLADSRRDSDTAASGPDPYYIRYLNVSGNTLSQIAIATQIHGEGDGSQPRFGQYVDFPSEPAATVQLVQRTNVLAERFISPHAPLLSLGPLIFDTNAQTIYLNWTASDADADPLTFTLQYSPDNGLTWRALRADYPNLEITLGTSLLPGSAQARIRVIASDGVNAALAASAPFAIAKHPPRCLIEGVRAGQRLNFGSETNLLGLALDAENGSLDNQLTWSLTGPNPRSASGNKLPLDQLSPGAYTARLTALDLDSMTNDASVQFEILPPMIPDGAVPDLDGIGNDDGYGEALFIPLPLEDGSRASVRAFHAKDRLYLSFANLKFGNGPPRSVGLRMDPMGMGDPANPMDLGFFVDENGVPREEQGDGANMVTTLSPQPGFAVSIHRTSNSWAAEFSISDSLLGGWGHPASMMLEHGPAYWPPLSAANQPNTWAPVILGTNPPAHANNPPVANAGPKQNFNLNTPQTVFLDGTASFDRDGTPLTFAWGQVGGPPVSLANTNTATPWFLASPVTNMTTLTFQLLVNDGDFTSAPSSAQVTLLPPLAQPPATDPVGGATLRGDGYLQVRLVGQPNRAYQVLASTDLISWHVLRTVYADLGPHRF